MLTYPEPKESADEECTATAEVDVHSFIVRVTLRSVNNLFLQAICMMFIIHSLLLCGDCFLFRFIPEMSCLIIGFWKYMLPLSGPLMSH